MRFSRSSCVSAATLALMVQLASCQFAQLLPAQQATQFDRTAFIINFHESIGTPDTVAQIASVDVEPEIFRSAAEAQSRAAAAAAERITQMASKAGITIERSETFGHVMTGMLLKVASEVDGQKLSEMLNADGTLGIKSLSHVTRFKVDFGKIQAADPNAVVADVGDTASAASDDPAVAEPSIWGGADQATLVDLAQNKYSGQGVRIAIVDDGLDYTHPAFGACTAINSGGKCRVVAGKDLVDGDMKTYDPCGSHGTHVAGIIGGDAMNINSRTVPWRGVAYKASLGAYRVFACDGTTQNDWLLQALEQAVKDRMTIINLSMGTSWTQPLGIEFTSRLAKQGVLVVAAAGNSGGDGLWTYGAPASETDSFAVGSTDNTYSLGAALTIDKAIKVQGKFTKTIDCTARALMQNPLPDLDTRLVLPTPASACGTITNKAAVAGKIALVPLTTCDEMTKASNLVDAGAAGVLFYNSQPYPSFKQSMNVDSLGPKARQMFCTDLATGNALTAALQAGQTIKLTKVTSKKYLNPNADKPSWFSSWGPDPSIRLLPTFSAPGGGILSSIPGNNFAEYQGTSMATPYVTGSLGLWRQAHQGQVGSGRSVLDAAKAAFINTAVPIKVDGGKFAHSVVVAGAGLIQVRSAIDNKVDVKPSYLSLPTGQRRSTVTVSLTNNGNKPVAYRLSHTPAMAVKTIGAWYEQEKTEKLAADVVFKNLAGTKIIHTLRIAPGATEKISAIISTDGQLRATPMFYSGYLSLHPISPARAAALEESASAGVQEDGVATVASAAANAVDFPAISVPYISLSQKYIDLPALAPSRSDVPEGKSLVNGKAYLCNLLDGKCAMDASSQVPTDLMSLRFGTVTFALPLYRPVDAAWVEIYNANNNQFLGKTASIGPVPWAGPKSLLQFPDQVSGSFFTGDYQASTSSSSNTQPSAKLGAGTYKFVLVLRKPVAVGDSSNVSAASDYTEHIEVLGRLVIQNSGSGGNGFGR